MGCPFEQVEIKSHSDFFHELKCLKQHSKSEKCLIFDWRPESKENTEFTSFWRLKREFSTKYFWLHLLLFWFWRQNSMIANFGLDFGRELVFKTREVLESRAWCGTNQRLRLSSTKGGCESELEDACCWADCGLWFDLQWEGWDKSEWEGT